MWLMLVLCIFLYRPLYSPGSLGPWDGKLGNYHIPRKFVAKSSPESVRRDDGARTLVPRVSTQCKDIVNYNVCVWMLDKT